MNGSVSGDWIWAWSCPLWLVPQLGTCLLIFNFQVWESSVVEDGMKLGSSVYWCCKNGLHNFLHTCTYIKKRLHGYSTNQIQFKTTENLEDLRKCLKLIDNEMGNLLFVIYEPYILYVIYSICLWNKVLQKWTEMPLKLRYRALSSSYAVCCNGTAQVPYKPYGEVQY